MTIGMKNVLGLLSRKKMLTERQEALLEQERRQLPRCATRWSASAPMSRPPTRARWAIRWRTSMSCFCW